MRGGGGLDSGEERGGGGLDSREERGGGGLDSVSEEVYKRQEVKYRWSWVCRLGRGLSLELMYRRGRP